MTAVVLPRPNVRPCQCDPEQWFDRRRHAAALAVCRRCPVRRWCASEALRCRASWGVWAGVWIDGQHDDAAPHLRAVADGTLIQSAAVASAIVSERQSLTDLIDTRHSPTREPLRRPRRSSRAGSTAAAILARSCGHCEVMADGCRYTYDRLLSRYPTSACSENLSPPACFASCGSCADMIAARALDEAAELGYLVNARRDPAQVPFFWRASRWVLFDNDGGCTELAERPDRIAV